MKIKIFQVDAFTGNVFSGNPAAVCPLPEWPDDSLLQAIAAENFLPETAFIVKDNNHYELRWFTPVSEIDLCGHATLAAAFVIMRYIDKSRYNVSFETKSGRLEVKRKNDIFAMNFPSMPPSPCKIPPDLVNALGVKPRQVLAARDYMAVYDSEEIIRSLRPDMSILNDLDKIGVIVTAIGKNCDFVSRFFAPKIGIPEDPATGSAHCELTPYWAKKLSKTNLRARQLSQRGGELFCEHNGERTTIAGKAALYMEGSIYLK